MNAWSAPAGPAVVAASDALDALDVWLPHPVIGQISTARNRRMRRQGTMADSRLALAFMPARRRMPCAGPAGGRNRGSCGARGQLAGRMASGPFAGIMAGVQREHGTRRRRDHGMDSRADSVVGS